MHAFKYTACMYVKKKRGILNLLDEKQYIKKLGFTTHLKTSNFCSETDLAPWLESFITNVLKTYILERDQCSVKEVLFVCLKRNVVWKWMLILARNKERE